MHLTHDPLLFKLPEDVTLVMKHVGIGAPNMNFCFMI